MNRYTEYLYKNYINCHLLRVFFEDREAFEEIQKAQGSDYHMDEQLYSDLFWFTNKNIYIPLWASVIKSGVDVLLNHVTYDAIKAYKSMGYKPVNIDGNPADYIGEQLRFTEYLYKALIEIEKEKDAIENAASEVTETGEVVNYNGMNDEQFFAYEDIKEKQRQVLEALYSFRNEFLIDSLHSVARDLKKIADDEEMMQDIKGTKREIPVGVGPNNLTQLDGVFCKASVEEMRESMLALIDFMDEVAGADPSEYLSVPDCKAEPVPSEKTAAFISGFDSADWKLNDPLPIEEPHIVNMASNCDCGGKCRTLTTAAEGCILEVAPDRYGTEIEFHGCPRGRAYPETYMTSKRMRYPMERIGERGEGRFRRITWEEATSKMAEATTRLGKVYGPGSRFIASAAGVCSAMRGDRIIKNMVALDGGYLDYYNYYSDACGVYINPYIFGQVTAANTEESYAYSKYIILWGHNPVEDHFNTQTKAILARAKENGAKIVVIDPRFSDTAITLADQWIPIRPSSDNALIDAMAYVIWDRQLQDQAFMDKYCMGLDEEHMPEGIPANESYKAAVFGLKDGIPKTPQWAEKITGIPAEIIEQLAIEYATVQPAALLPGFSVQRTMVGEQVVRGLVALACLTGNPARLGGSTGSTFTRGGHDAPFMAVKPNPYGVSIPSFYWSRAIDRPETIDPLKRGLIGRDKLETGIKMIYSLASGLVMNQHSNINETAEILKKKNGLEMLVTSDLFMTPTMAFTDIALPAVSFFEIDNMPSPWTANNFILYNTAMTKPVFEGRFEYFWIREVAQKMGIGEAFDEGHNSYEEWLCHLYVDFRQFEPEIPPYEEFKKAGIYIYEKKTDCQVFRKQFEEDVPFNTPSGKIEIFSKALYELGKKQEREDQIPGTAGYTFCDEGPVDEKREKYPLQFFAYHTKRRCHSQHDQNKLLAELDPTALWINPEDAEARGIKDGDLVEAFNDRGVMRIPAKVTPKIMKGCISVSEGGWYTPDKDGADIGGSVNILTRSDWGTPIANGNPQHTNLADVRLAKVE